MRRRHLQPLLPLLLAAGVAAQSSSALFVLPAADGGDGGVGASTTWRIAGSLGSGVAGRASSPTYVMLGGFTASHEAPVAGAPWLTGLLPLYGPLKGGTALDVHGTELHLGSSPALQIGGKSSTIGSRQNHRITTTLPPQTLPGWQPVTLTTSLGTTTLPRGIGILPMLSLERPTQPGTKFQLDYRGNTGDLVIFILAPGSGPPIPLPGYGYRFELDPFNFLVLTSRPVVDSGGVLSLRLPAVNWSRRVLFQCLVISVNAGYAPGAFTNSVEL